MSKLLLQTECSPGSSLRGPSQDFAVRQKAVKACFLHFCLMYLYAAVSNDARVAHRVLVLHLSIEHDAARLEAAQHTGL